MTEIFNQQPQKELRQILRRDATDAEILLWSRLRSRKLGGYKFRRQYGIGYYVVDFYCVEARVVIELDGAIHFSKEARLNDEDRQKNIEALGLCVLRFTNDEIFSELQNVLERISEKLVERCPPSEGGRQGV